MIVNIKGTSGAGKSYVARAVIDRVGASEVWERQEATLFGAQGAGRVLRYEAETASGRLVVLGDYRTTCGGVDSMMPEGRSRDQVKATIAEHASAGASVIYEGLIASDVTRVVELSQVFPVAVVYLDVTLDECLDTVRARRAARGDERPFSTVKTVAKFKEIQSQIKRLREAGVAVHSVRRDEAVACVLGLVGAA